MPPARPLSSFPITFVTTPSADHRFEWARAEFAAWATTVAERHGYQVRIEPMGEEAEGVGGPSQMAVLGLLPAPNQL